MPAGSDAGGALPPAQLGAALGGWLTAEAGAGRMADDHRRPPAELATKIRAAFAEAGECADGLARGSLRGWSWPHAKPGH
jgi:hypothetical protein